MSITFLDFNHVICNKMMDFPLKLLKEKGNYGTCEYRRLKKEIGNSIVMVILPFIIGVVFLNNLSTL